MNSHSTKSSKKDEAIYSNWLVNVSYIMQIMPLPGKKFHFFIRTEPKPLVL